MNVVVVDASVAAKWFFPEDHSEAASRLRAEQFRLHAPDFLYLEIDALFAKRMRRGEITQGEGKSSRIALRKLPINIHDSSTLASPAFDLSCETGGSFYDCLYLALAMNLDAVLASADRRFMSAVDRAGLAKSILWVGDIPSDSA